MGTHDARLSYPLDLVSLARDDKVPLHRQLCAQFRDLILQGAVPGGVRFPSIRNIAAELGISRNTVVAALDQLTAEGLVESRRGSGIRVSPFISGRLAASPQARNGQNAFSSRGQLMISQPRVRTVPGRAAFHPGTPELAQFPFKTWSRLLLRRARYGGDDLFGYHFVAGYPELRAVIASFLSAMRRVRCTPEQIVVTTGGQAGLDLLARVLLEDGDTVWMEEPGYLGARGAFLGAGARLAPLPVNRDGWQVPAVGDPPPRLIYLTPSCQHPLGVTMPLDQRLAVLDVARATGAWVIEDDFDGEYTSRGQPLPAMQGLADDSRVIYVGTFSKTLFPAMRLGFVVLPLELADHIRPAISLTGQFPPLVLQAALADFIEQGYFFRHLNRMRQLYVQRRALFLASLKHDLAEWLSPIDGRSGIQIAAPFVRDDIDDCEIVARAAAADVNVAPLSLYFHGAVAMRGLLMGYAGVAEKDMRAPLRRLRDVFRETVGG